ncbi:hypothetical protein I9W82_004368 [Candida metapsilosis]|uniref:AMP-dependent synthetase/ligase domain-containing protein n=1 Tax=Candida metapsilosis TaxID=273372 RepID=A0A8H8D9T8_9ASCO|nr:hypothetical protein I9W82_004368 [Candida metapsilosis]
MALKLPSIRDSDLNSLFAADEDNYLFQNVNELPDDVLINQCLPLPENLSARSVKIPGTAKPGFSKIYRNAALPNGLKDSLTPELNTYPKMFASAVKRQADRPCLAYHEYDYENEQHKERYTSFTFQQVDTRKTNFANGLMYLLENNPYKNLALESHQKIVNHSKEYKGFNKDNISYIVTIYSANRVEWLLTDLACSENSITNTALYDTLGPTSSKFILGLTQSPVVVCSKEKIETLINLKASNPKDLESLITIVCMDPLNVKGKSSASLIKLAEANNIKLYEFSQVEKVGEAFPREKTPPSQDTVYTFTFTSGTTGANPKGVVLSQKTVACALSAYVMMLPHHKNMKELAFLPLAHIFERQMTAACLFVGGCVGFCRLGGTPLTLFEDMKLFKPTFFANVPRIFTKMEASIKAATIDSPSQRGRGVTKDAKGEYIFDKELVKKLRSKFGFDEVECCISGSAPMAPETMRFLKESLGMGFIYGYGSSESFAGMCMALPFHGPSVGTCGALTPTIEARVRELPEMGYYLNDKGGPRGELQLRGPQMFSHYYKNEEETTKSIDSEGWFSTGDVAQFTGEGWVIIFDRVKNFFKLSQGEYVTPDKIENLYLSSNSMLTQAFAHGNSAESYLVAILGVDPSAIVSFLTERCNIAKRDLDTEEKILEVCNRREIRTQILLQLNSTVGSLNGFEKFGNIFIDFEPLKLEREVVTPTSKIRRPIAAKYFKPQIDAMYKEGSILRNLKL